VVIELNCLLYDKLIELVFPEPIPDKRQEPPNPREPLEQPVVPELLEKPSTRNVVDVIKKDDMKVMKNEVGVDTSFNNGMWSM